MGCCERTAYDVQFDGRAAERELRAYRKKGPVGSTRRLIEAIADGGVSGLTVLDIGGGVGAVHHELLSAGAVSAVDADASGPYLAAARREAERREWGDRATYLHGDAVALAGELGDADLVTLDKVVCCYPDMTALIGLAASRARRRLGIVLPRDAAWIRLGIAATNLGQRLRLRDFRVFAHPTVAVLATTAGHGLTPTYRHRGWFWETIILAR